VSHVTPFLPYTSVDRKIREGAVRGSQPVTARLFRALPWNLIAGDVGSEEDIDKRATVSHRVMKTDLYHAAMAPAFVHHDAEISGRPMHKQQMIYERFAATFGEQPLGRLFRDAAARVARTPPP
jgi:hypothetical protein